MFKMRACALFLLFVGISGWASPYRGAELPGLNGRFLNGQKFTNADLKGKPALLVIITKKEAANDAETWFEAADRHGISAREVALVSIHKPFFVTMAYVRHHAKKVIPQKYWSSVVLDGGQLSRTLGVAKSDEPMALAVDGSGQIVAVSQGQPEGSSAYSVFAALGGK